MPVVRLNIVPTAPFDTSNRIHTHTKMDIHSMNRLLTLIVTSAGALLGTHTMAQSYPVKPVRAILPAGTGTPTDLVGRAIGQAITTHLGQQIIIENRVGANGIIGMEACMKAAPDGYTLCLVANAQIGLNPFVYAKLPYDPIRDYLPVIQTGAIHNALSINAALPANNFKEFIAYAKTRPGELNWASWGTGSPSHLSLAWLEAHTGTRFTHVLYKEPSMAWLAVQTGEAHVITNPTGMTSTMVKAGKLKALAVGGTRRSDFLPGVPTFSDEGLDFTYRGWNGILAPNGTTREVVLRVNTAINSLLADKVFASKSLLPLGVEPAGGTPEEFAAFIRQEMKNGQELVRLANIKPQ
jgi:tripartite-type tricarboxylate transporter receptor subunit TctC